MENLWQGQLDLELTQLDSLSEQQTEVERRLEAIADRIGRLRTIAPGCFLHTRLYFFNAGARAHVLE